MSGTNEEVRNVIQHLLLEGLEVSVTAIQAILRDKGLSVQDDLIVSILNQEGGPLPAYHGFRENVS